MSEKTLETRRLSNSKNRTRELVMPHKKTELVPTIRVLSGNPRRGQPYRLQLYGDGRAVTRLSQMGANDRLDAFKRMFGDGPLTRTFMKDCRCGNDPNADKAAACMALSAIEGTKNGEVRFGRNAINVDPSRKGFSIGSIQVCAAGKKGDLSEAARERSLRKYDVCVQTGLHALALIGQGERLENLNGAQMDQVAKLGHDLPRFVSKAFGQEVDRPIKRKGPDGKMQIVGHRKVRLPYQGAYTAEHVNAYFRNLETKLGGKNTAKEISQMHGSIAQTGKAVASSIIGGKLDLEIV